jgi:hypothetical protein
MCINNIAVIDNNYGRLKDLILLFKISLGTRNNFFEIHREFRHAPSKRFASPGVEGEHKSVKGGRHRRD